MKTLLTAILFFSATGASAQMVVDVNVCPYKVIQDIHQKGRSLADDIAYKVANEHDMLCVFKNRTGFLDLTSDTFRYKCYGTEDKLTLRVSIENDYCRLGTVRVGNYKVKY